MNLVFCVAKSDVFHTLRKHEQIVKEMMELKEEQQTCFFMPFDEVAMKDRARLFFGCEDIMLHEHTLYFHHKLRNITYEMKLYKYYIYVYDSFRNPFLPFIKRLYRNNFTWELEGVEETDTKVL